MARVLIFRVGSIGDTVVALPCFRFIAEAFPSAERHLLTYISGNDRTAPVRAILDGSDLVHGYIEYSDAERTVSGYRRLAQRVRSWGPDVLVYLMEPKGLRRTIQDAVFFKVACGVPKLVGLPLSARRRRPRALDRSGTVEKEAERLARCLEGLGARVGYTGVGDLLVSASERAAAAEALKPLPSAAPMLAASVGAKLDVKDWGDDRWAALLSELSGRIPGWSLVMVGARSEAGRSGALMDRWAGPSLNLCGRLTPRQSAAALERAEVFVGHDSGPMHMAAAVGTRCVAIFSARNPPGEWFPMGEGHRILYHKPPCFGCRLEVCARYGKRCIRSITVEEVLAAIDDALSGGSGLRHE